LRKVATQQEKNNKWFKIYRQKQMRRKTLPYDKEIHFTIFTKSKRWTKGTIKATVYCLFL
jgi:hypothetical protein